MTDIVERLRAREAFVLNGHRWMMVPQPDADCVEAANWIERLRQACDGYLGELAAMRENKDAEIERLRERVAELEKECLDRGKLIKALSKP